MGTITIKNQSTLYDCAAVLRVARLLAGEPREARQGSKKNSPVVNITKRGNTYTVTDAEEVE
ncbi:MAG: hypothetical protein ACLU8W_10050 [Clostridia bacterium]